MKYRSPYQYMYLYTWCLKVFFFSSQNKSLKMMWLYSISISWALNMIHTVIWNLQISLLHVLIGGSIPIFMKCYSCSILIECLDVRQWYYFLILIMWKTKLLFGHVFRCPQRFPLPKALFCFRIWAFRNANVLDGPSEVYLCTYTT